MHNNFIVSLTKFSGTCDGYLTRKQPVLIWLAYGRQGLEIRWIYSLQEVSPSVMIASTFSENHDDGDDYSAIPIRLWTAQQVCKRTRLQSLPISFF